MENYKGSKFSFLRKIIKEEKLKMRAIKITSSEKLYAYIVLTTLIIIIITTALL